MGGLFSYIVSLAIFVGTYMAIERRWKPAWAAPVGPVPQAVPAGRPASPGGRRAPADDAMPPPAVLSVSAPTRPAAEEQHPHVHAYCAELDGAGAGGVVLAGRTVAAAGDDARRLNLPYFALEDGGRRAWGFDRDPAPAVRAWHPPDSPLCRVACSAASPLGLPATTSKPHCGSRPGLSSVFQNAFWTRSQQNN